MRKRKPARGDGAVDLDRAVARYARTHPRMGQAKVAAALQAQGVAVSASGVRYLWRKRGLETAYKRLKAIEDSRGRAAKLTVDQRAILRRGETRACSLLTDDSATVTIGGEGPLMPNAGGTGYYRFELPDADWDALIAQAERLPGGEAQALADSLAASLHAGRADTARLASLVQRPA